VQAFAPSSHHASTMTAAHRHGHPHYQESPKSHPSSPPRHRSKPKPRGSRRIVAFVVILVVSIHAGLVVYFQLSLAFLQEGFYAALSEHHPWGLSYEDSHNESLANETMNSTVHTPPPPWPSRRDGCSAEDGTRPYCRFHNLLVDLSRISSAAIGGEPLFAEGDALQSKGVMGQGEMDEYLTYQPGAFRILAEPKKKPIVDYNSPVSFHYVNDVLSSLQVVNVPNISAVSIKEQNCTSYFYGTTLFLQRWEYVNLYHTLTDWWNTWTVYRHVKERDLAHFAVVFLDAHPEGGLDPVWTTLFGKAVHLRRLDDDNIHPRQQERLCFQRALLVPPGYISHLWPLEPPNGGVGDNRTYEMMNPFVDFVLERFQLTHVRKIRGRVVIIDRQPYVAHPRSRTVEDRSLNNLPDVARKLTENVSNITSVRIVQLHNMTFREQVEAIREAEVLVGNHGAGLSHLVFMDNNSHVIEFEMNFLRFFNHLSACKQGRVTLHQLPDVRGSISDGYFNNLLLPEFLRIYGIPQQP
jgi:Glycosyltransferase 61